MIFEMQVIFVQKMCLIATSRFTILAEYINLNMT